jgi:hypothetical protein
MRLPNDQYDIEVQLTLYPTDQGGRRTPMFFRPNDPDDRNYPDYRSGHVALDHGLWIASFVPKDRNRELLFPGETALMLVAFYFHPEALAGRLWVGREFVLEEPGRPIGQAVITAMLNFEQHAEEYTACLRRRAHASGAE